MVYYCCGLNEAADNKDMQSLPIAIQNNYIVQYYIRNYVLYDT